MAATKKVFKPVKRCTECNRPLYSQNRSGICTLCQSKLNDRKKRIKWNIKNVTSARKQSIVNIIIGDLEKMKEILFYALIVK